MLHGVFVEAGTTLLKISQITRLHSGVVRLFRGSSEMTACDERGVGMGCVCGDGGYQVW